MGDTAMGNRGCCMDSEARGKTQAAATIRTTNVSIKPGSMAEIVAVFDSDAVQGVLQEVDNLLGVQIYHMTGQELVKKSSHRGKGSCFGAAAKSRPESMLVISHFTDHASEAEARYKMQHAVRAMNHLLLGEPVTLWGPEIFSFHGESTTETVVRYSMFPMVREPWALRLRDILTSEAMLKLFNDPSYKTCNASQMWFSADVNKGIPCVLGAVATWSDREGMNASTPLFVEAIEGISELLAG